MLVFRGVTDPQGMCFFKLKVICSFHVNSRCLKCVRDWQMVQPMVSWCFIKGGGLLILSSKIRLE